MTCLFKILNIPDFNGLYKTVERGVKGLIKDIMLSREAVIETIKKLKIMANMKQKWSKLWLNLWQPTFSKSNPMYFDVGASKTLYRPTFAHTNILADW